MDRYGVIGWPVEHSLSPAMQNAAFKALGIEAKYEKIPVEPRLLKDFLLNNKEYKGFNITVPHKVRAMEIIKGAGRLRHTQDIIRRQTDNYYIEFCGAINAVKREGKDFICTNTDVSGFMESLTHDLPGFKHTGKNVLLIGCGGAGRAIIAGLTSSQNSCSKICIFDNDQKTIESVKALFGSFAFLKDKLEFISGRQLAEKIKDCHFLVNATPVGMKKGDPPVIDKNLLHENLSVYDVVYNRETELVKDARSKKLPAVNGLGMLLYQGIKTLEFWIDDKPVPEKVANKMKEALSKALA